LRVDRFNLGGDGLTISSKGDVKDTGLEEGDSIARRINDVNDFKTQSFEIRLKDVGGEGIGKVPHLVGSLHLAMFPQQLGSDGAITEGEADQSGHGSRRHR